MPLTGELEHLPIVDVIQLIHSTRKTGTLNVYSRKGEGQLVFNSGYIVGATHSNEKLRIGQILCEAEIITQEDLDKALEIQNNAADDRKPLIATLLDHCGLSKEAAFKSLEKLIEATIVEMIAWSKGFFSLEMDKIDIFDEYRYLPSQLQELNLNTQMVLMDALRIFDEKVHAGEIQIVDEPLEEIPDFTREKEAEPPQEEDIIVSEDILGLADLDKIERKKPHVFKSLEAFDPADIHRQVIATSLPELSDEERGKLADFLLSQGRSTQTEDSSNTTASPRAIILFSADEFIQHAVMTICKDDGQRVFATSESKQLDDLINRSLSKSLEPILIFGSPDESTAGFNADDLANYRAKKAALYPEIPIIQLARPEDTSFTLEALQTGTRSVLPKPDKSKGGEVFLTEMMQFLKALQCYIANCYNAKRRQHFDRMRKSMTGLSKLNRAPEISLAILQFIGETFERSLTLIVDKNTLVAERSIGIVADKSQGACPAQKFRFEVADDSIFKHVINDGETFFGPVKDPALELHLFPAIGTPLESTILLVPLQSNGRTITLTYADFGNGTSRQVPVEFIEFFADQAGIAMENALFRRQLAKPTKPLEGQ